MRRSLARVRQACSLRLHWQRVSIWQQVHHIICVKRKVLQAEQTHSVNPILDLWMQTATAYARLEGIKVILGHVLMGMHVLCFSEHACVPKWITYGAVLERETRGLGCAGGRTDNLILCKSENDMHVPRNSTPLFLFQFHTWQATQPCKQQVLLCTCNSE